MKGRPILMSSPMIRALLDGTKTQTRRVVKPQPVMRDGEPIWPIDAKRPRGRGFEDCPYGQPGDRLSVKEALRYCSSLDSLSPAEISERAAEAGYKSPWAPIQYEADKERRDWIGIGSSLDLPTPGRYRHARFMPRWAGRITLEITDVRVERLQDISAADAVAEGLTGLSKDGKLTKYGIPDRDGLPGTDDLGWPWHEWRISPIDAYRHLWESLHGTGSWDANPLVWAITFRRIA